MKIVIRPCRRGRQWTIQLRVCNSKFSLGTGQYGGFETKEKAREFADQILGEIEVDGVEITEEEK